MHRVLKHAGVPDAVLKLIPEIVPTCVNCRAWARPPSSSVAIAELEDTFNQQVECDLMFAFDKVVFRLLDWCTRWRAACAVTSKEGMRLTDALNKLWIGAHGPMRELIVDGE
eukprot:12665855-Alexandrium_andersonii.AAC.1